MHDHKGFSVSKMTKAQQKEIREKLLAEREVLVDQIDVWVDDGELVVGLAAQKVGRAGGLVVEQLSEVHALISKLVGLALDKLSSERLNSNGWRLVTERVRCSKRSR